MATNSTRATLATYCGRIARNKDAAFTDALTDPTRDEKDNRVFLELADTFALSAQVGTRVTELMVHLADLGESGHETALLSFLALHKKDVQACERAVKAFAMTRNKMTNEKQRSYDANVAKVWGETSIRINKAGEPELYTPAKRAGKGKDQNKKKARSDAHARAIIRAWRYRAEVRATKAALDKANKAHKATKAALNKATKATKATKVTTTKATDKAA